MRKNDTRNSHRAAERAELNRQKLVGKECLRDAPRTISHLADRSARPTRSSSPYTGKRGSPCSGGEGSYVRERREPYSSNSPKSRPRGKKDTFKREIGPSDAKKGKKVSKKKVTRVLLGTTTSGQLRIGALQVLRT